MTNSFFPTYLSFIPIHVSNRFPYIVLNAFSESHLCTTSEDGTFKLLDLNSRKAVKRMEWQGFIVYCVTPMSRYV